MGPGFASVTPQRYEATGTVRAGGEGHLDAHGLAAPFDGTAGRIPEIRHHHEHTWKGMRSQRNDPASVDLVITLCAEEVCPAFLGRAQRTHWPLQDPDRKDEDLSDEERLQYFRVAREQIKGRLEELAPTLRDKEPEALV